jgi:hypothetical protein
MKRVRWKATGHLTEIKGKGALTAEVDTDIGSHRYQVHVFFDGAGTGEKACGYGESAAHAKRTGLAVAEALLKASEWRVGK